MHFLLLVTSAVWLAVSPGTAASDDASGAANVSESFSSNTRDCIANTGAFCINSCNPSRGPGRCHWGRCFCDAGACSGADQVCHTGAAASMNIIAGGQRYRIRNSRWPDYFLYASHHGPLTASTWYSSSENFQWTLKSPPDFDANRSASYLIHSVRWPDAAMVIEEDVVCARAHNNVTREEIENYTLDPNNTNMSLPEGYDYAEPQLPSNPEAYDDPENFDSLDLGGRRLASCSEVHYPFTRYVQGNWLKWGADPPISDLLMHFERAPAIHQESPDDQLVMIKNSHNSYLYMPSWGLWGAAGWGTRAYHEDPGAGGYWYFDPPLPAEVWDAMPSYSGQTCDFDCGSVSPIMGWVDGAQVLTWGFAILFSVGTALVMAQ